MGRNRHTCLVMHVAGTEQVDKAPRTSHSPFLVRQKPQHLVAGAGHGVHGVVDPGLTPVRCRVVGAAGVDVSDGVAHGPRILPVAIS